MEYKIDKMIDSDWEQVQAIYIQGIQTKNATFEEAAPSWESWNKGHIEVCRFVVREGEKIHGWAALSPTSDRRAFAGIAELSIYLRLESAGKGIGILLIQKMIEASEAAGFWTLQSGIFPENVSSMKLHEKAGFRIIGIRERMGKLNGVWRDVAMMERRSKIVGMD
ncbi:GNAT family N-acetyltransferase [Oceanobacillus saliphilus]|uniref:GNAT family N-acetyltransferase n=1 Tax=Oceanobacillus saliphilus TaxID=2925834 RepID=UPI00201E1310|nr:GNAT family N-acetyltransferase [Oceanobacillus saliphilus]